MVIIIIIIIIIIICCLLYCDSFGLYSCMYLICYLVLWPPDWINATTTTWLGNFADLHALFSRHETKHGEDSKSGIDTRTAVDDGQCDAAPITTQLTRLTLHEKRHNDG